MKALRGWFIATLIASAARIAAAQTVVRVQADGFPVSGAEVTAWDAGGRLAVNRTNGLGIARITADRPITSVAFLLVRRLGFAPVRVAYTGRDSVTITLSAAPASLPVLSIDSKALRCPAASEAAADSLWRAASSRYSLGATRLYLGWVGAQVEETVSSEQRGYGEGYELHATLHGGTLPDTTAKGAVLLREPPPYALFERHLNLLGEFWRWRYAPLEDFAAEHFVSERFHERHTMLVLGRSADATVIGFCARDRAQAEIEGELQIGSDMLLRSARWFYRVPHDDEDAGAESIFGRTSFEGASYLVALRGSSWRRAGHNLYNQVRYEKLRWRLGRSLDAVQFDRGITGEIARPVAKPPDQER